MRALFSLFINFDYAECDPSFVVKRYSIGQISRGFINFLARD